VINDYVDCSRNKGFEVSPPPRGLFRWHMFFVTILTMKWEEAHFVTIVTEQDFCLEQRQGNHAVESEIGRIGINKHEDVLSYSS
jgi:hypothetical protein